MRRFLPLVAFSFVLATSSQPLAQDNCDVVVRLSQPEPTGEIAFGIDYSAAGGSSSATAACPASAPPGAPSV